MNLLEEYKELYYKEIEYSESLNNKIGTTITFLTILGSAQILLWTKIKEFQLYWYTGVYLILCCISTILFLICIGIFIKTYSGHKTQKFPIRDVAIHNSNVLNNVSEDQEELAKKNIEICMAARFINDAIHNRKVNIIKNDRHRMLIKLLLIAFVTTFITFAINVVIDIYETKTNTYIQEIHIEGGEINVR